MHAIHPDFRRLLAAAGAALVLTVAALIVPPAAGELDLRLGSGSEASSGAPPAPVVRPAPSQPRWLTEPVTPPAFTLR